MQAKRWNAGRPGCFGRAALALWLAAAMVVALLPGRGGAAASLVPVTPAEGASVASADAPRFSWTPIPGAVAYHVVFGDGERAGPWVPEPAWQSGTLPAGAYRWHVVADLGDRLVASPEVRFTVGEPVPAGGAGTAALEQRAPAGDEDASSRAGKVDGLVPDAASNSGPAAPAPISDTPVSALPVSDPPVSALPVSDAPVSDAPSTVATGPRPVPLVTLASDAAIVGTVVTVYGTGFAPGEPVDLRWRPSDRPGMEAPTADERGAWTVAILVPDVPGGPQALHAVGEDTGDEATAPLAVLPALARDPAGGPPGTEVVVSASGFGPDETVALRLADAGEDAAPLATAQTTGSGSGRLKLTIPRRDPGLAGVVAVGATSGLRAEATLRVDPVVRRRDGDAAPTATALQQIGSSRAVGAGAFAVLAAPVGEVGGATSSGHLVQPGDRYASLPVCTTTSCPWLAPGTNHPVWGTRVECGDACLIRVENPATGQCTIAPVLDTGPWFIGDDWWSPTDRRRVNRAPGAVYQLAEGYPAAQAARDGYDLGFGRGPDGVGISDQGYEVGNGAAVGLGPGSWADLGLAPGSPAQTVVTLLWLAGEDPATAKSACAAAPAADPPPTAPAAQPIVAAAPPATNEPSADPSAAPAATPTPEPASPATLSASPDGATASPGQRDPGTATPAPGEVDAAQSADATLAEPPATTTDAPPPVDATSEAPADGAAPDATEPPDSASPDAADPAATPAADATSTDEAAADAGHGQGHATRRDRKADDSTGAAADAGDPGSADEPPAATPEPDPSGDPAEDVSGGYGGTRLGLRAGELRDRHGLGPNGGAAPAPAAGEGNGAGG